MVPTRTRTVVTKNEMLHGGPSTLPSDPCPREGKGEGKGNESKGSSHCLGGSGKDAIVAAVINRHHHQGCRHRRHRLNPTAPTIDGNCYGHRRGPQLLLLHSQQRRPPEGSGCCLSLTVAMVVIVDGSSGLWWPWGWWSLSTLVVIDGGSDGMEGQDRNGIHGCSIFGQWWWRQ